MKALTTSELNTKLIQKGFSICFTNYIPANKWQADSFIIIENKGISYMQMMKKISDCRAKVVVSYSKLKAAEKKELAEFLLSINL